MLTFLKINKPRRKESRVCQIHKRRAMKVCLGMRNAQSGFTLLECIFAITILGVILGSIIALQASVIAVTDLSTERLKASWALKDAQAQLSYVIDTRGQSSFKEEVTFPWVSDENFNVTIAREEFLDVRPSDLLLSILNLYNATQPEGNVNVNMAQTLAPILSYLDAAYQPSDGSQVGSTPFAAIRISVNWKNGSQAQTLNQVSLYIDKGVLQNLNLSGLGNSSSSSGSGSSDTK